MKKNDSVITTKQYMYEAHIDWEMNMANSISGQILNNEYCRENYARILAIATLKVHEALKND